MQVLGVDIVVTRHVRAENANPGVGYGRLRGEAGRVAREENGLLDVVEFTDLLD